ncbi:hypothetical protein BDZ91DRAFT_717170 [Kalaharituber pfeilii]|nr:hypothetical protein BDZ91DRAFT_717170 [Kalaharituber pfeilii]
MERQRAGTKFESSDIYSVTMQVGPFGNSLSWTEDKKRMGYSTKDFGILARPSNKVLYALILRQRRLLSSAVSCRVAKKSRPVWMPSLTCISSSVLFVLGIGRVLSRPIE